MNDINRHFALYTAGICVLALGLMLSTKVMQEEMGFRERNAQELEDLVQYSTQPEMLASEKTKKNVESVQMRIHTVTNESSIVNSSTGLESSSNNESNTASLNERSQVVADVELRPFEGMWKFDPISNSSEGEYFEIICIQNKLTISGESFVGHGTITNNTANYTWTSSNASDLPNSGRTEIVIDSNGRLIGNVKYPNGLSGTFTARRATGNKPNGPIPSNTLSNHNVTSAPTLPSTTQDQPTYKQHSSNSLTGTWECITNIDGVSFTIHATFNSNGRVSYNFRSRNGVSRNSGTWKYSNQILHERWQNGAAGSGQIWWISNDEFEITIINNGKPSDSGRTRRYRRIG